ncbi:MAG: DNA mismatch repair endonuclease MutL [Vicinamibacteria bacterium]|nr:DNA mismatch repair endonuclease MutL [Vicinamibacteria bacterium]
MEETKQPGRIRRLSEDLVNKIAAGEVVERPASIVKELVENALDAGARQVVVEIEHGGKSLIRVRDDGCGMSRDDAVLSVERHATSKIAALDDLERVATHGFRGEALPSIASVCALVLTTREEGATAGTEVAVHHGRMAHVRDTAHPRGTTVEARDLFNAVPARRKFLRADATEAAHVAEAITVAATSRPETGFRMTSGGRIVVEAPATRDLAQRLYQLFGDDVLMDLAPLEWSGASLRVSGFVSRPDRPAPARPAIRLFVNGRPVRDRMLAKAATDAYRGAGVSNPRPVAFVFIEIPPHAVDVNVHPAKTEVRFADMRAVFGGVERAVMQALSATSRETAPAPFVESVAEPGTPYRVTPGWAQRDIVFAGGAPGDGEGSAVSRGVSFSASDAEPELASDDRIVVLGQHRHTYIVASDGEDLLLVDQHTAHERVRFETLVAQFETRSVETQRLIEPLVLTLPPRLRPLVKEHAAALSDLGFETEDFGGAELRLGSVPALLRGLDPRAAVEGILRDLLDRDADGWIVPPGRERLAATIACHSAVRAGQVLAREAMAAIVRDLARTRHPTMCPHGRPAIVRIPKDDVSRWFGRKGWRRE